MLKKKNFWYRLKYIKCLFKSHELSLRIVKALRRHHQLPYKRRLSLFAVFNKYQFYKNFYHSYNKLICLRTLSTRVHSRKFLHSRFFLNRHISLLKTSSLWKSNR